MKNRYGGPLRQLVAEEFHLKIYVDMVDTPAFHTDVIAYPAITIIAREKPGTTRIAHRPEIDARALALWRSFWRSACRSGRSGARTRWRRRGARAMDSGIVRSAGAGAATGSAISRPWRKQAARSASVLRPARTKPSSARSTHLMLSRIASCRW